MCRLYKCFDFSKILKNPNLDEYCIFNDNNNLIFNKYNIDIVDDMANADCFFYIMNMGFSVFKPKDIGFFEYYDERPWDNQVHIKNLLKIKKNFNKKIFVYFRDDGSSILDYLYVEFKNNNLIDDIVILKDFCFNFDKINLSQQSFVRNGGLYAIYLNTIYELFKNELNKINITYGINLPKKCSTESIEWHKNNIKICPTFTSGYDYLSKRRVAQNTPIDDKTIDVFFVKSMRNTLDGFYRQKIKDKLLKIKNIELFTQNIDDPNEYLKIMSKSKIVISAWGLGESEWEMKPILNNCILLKVDTSYINNYYGFYDEKNEMINYFKPDLSDLEDKIYFILANYNNFLNKAINANNRLLTFTKEKHIEDFSSIFNQ
jgi:hypothetical protein